MSRTGAYVFKRFDPTKEQDHWDTPKGHWHAWRGVEAMACGDTERTFVLITCPDCGNAGMLPHRIDAQGGVHPSIVCSASACGFHTMPNTLESWDFGERPDTKENWS